MNEFSETLRARLRRLLRWRDESDELATRPDPRRLHETLAEVRRGLDGGRTPRELRDLRRSVATLAALAKVHEDEHLAETSAELEVLIAQGLHGRGLAAIRHELDRRHFEWAAGPD